MIKNQEGKKKGFEVSIGLQRGAEGCGGEEARGSIAGGEGGAYLCGSRFNLRWPPAALPGSSVPSGRQQSSSLTVSVSLLLSHDYS